ncbi:T9SS type A sorting domain-containing protein, partial [bacterium]|nr:T9SS type A sorting domain-containing protein [bacterium]
RNAILVGSYVMVNPDNWQKNVDLYDGPANTNLALSYECSDLVLYNGSKTIPAESVQVNSNLIATLALGDAELNIVQVPLFHAQAPNDPQHFVGTVTVTARGEGMVVSDEFTLEVKQVAGTAPLASSLCFGGEPLPEGNRLYWSRFGFGEQGYKLYRARIDSEEFTIINDNPLVTTECTDYDVEPVIDYKYKLGLEMPNGKEITIGPLSLTSSSEVGNIVLYETSPNPWVDVTEISYFIPRDITSAQLKVYDITGKLVKTLVDGPQDSGNHSVTWDGTDERGRTISSGVYFYILNARDQKQTKKTILVR